LDNAIEKVPLVTSSCSLYNGQKGRHNDQSFKLY
jgi:hypothetical protein